MTRSTQPVDDQALIEPLPLVETPEGWRLEADPMVLCAKNEAQQTALWAATCGDYTEIYYGGAGGGGKEIDLNEVVPTPDGWKRVGDIQPGDVLFDETGAQCRVVALAPIHQRPVSYRLTFDDGAEIVCCKDHRWKTLFNGEWAVRDTQAIVDSGRDHVVPAVGPLQGWKGKGGFARPPRRIVDAELVEPRPMRCLQVDSPSSLFLVTRHMIPTHNSWIVKALAIIKALEVPGCNVLLVMATIDEVRDKMFGELEQMIPPELLGARGVRLTPKPCIELINGSKIWGLPGEEEKTFRSWNNVNFIGVDEATDCNEQIFPVMFSRFRKPKNSKLRPVLFFASNPGGTYLYKRFVANPHANPKTTLFIPALASDNGYIDSEDYLQTMKTHMTPSEYRRLALGQWEGTQGLVYPRYKRSRHAILNGLPAGKRYTYVQGMDYATRNVTCIVFLARDDEGVIYAYDEIWGEGMSTKDIAIQYHDKCELHRIDLRDRRVVADHNMWTDRDGQSPAKDLLFDTPTLSSFLPPEYAMPLIQADKNAERIKNIELFLDADSFFQDPEKCPNVVQSLERLEFKKDSKQDKKDDYRASKIARPNKDAFDACSYGFNDLFKPGPKQAPPKFVQSAVGIGGVMDAMRQERDDYQPDFYQGLYRYGTA